MKLNCLDILVRNSSTLINWFWFDDEDDDWIADVGVIKGEDNNLKCFGNKDDDNDDNGDDELWTSTPLSLWLLYIG